MATRSKLVSLLLAALGTASIVPFAAIVAARQPSEATRPAALVQTKPVSLREQPSPSVDALVAEILQRPLFSPSRRPPDNAPMDESAKAEKEPLKLPGRLEGTAILPGIREALFEREGDKPVAVKEGQNIDGWTVASIQPDRVILRSDDGEQIVKPASDARTKPRPVLVASRKPATKKPKHVAVNGPQPQPAALAAQPQRLVQPIIPGR